jgi:replication-associated recombination protein RarA
MNPQQFKPETLEDFCGPALAVGTLLRKLIQSRKPNGVPIRLLLKGQPGVGKSALAKWVVREITDQPWDVKFFNGTEINTERVAELKADLSYATMGGGYRVVHIDEADAIPSVAHVRFLSYMDKLKETPFAAIVITSNEDLDKFEERFQTRFQAFDVEGPNQQELAAFLQKFTPDTNLIGEVVRCAFHQGGMGNVRQALDDLDTALLAA